jgi:hypothetical protein
MNRRRSTHLAPCVLAVLAFMRPTPAAAQRVYLNSVPTVCPTPVQPVSGITFHAGYAWQIVWTTTPGSWHVATYRGPSRVASTDGNAVWTDPSLLAECWIDWFQMAPTPRLEAQFRWHVVTYFGSVDESDAGDCGDSTELLPVGGEPYNPYDSGSGLNPCNGGGGENPGGGGAGESCHQEWIIVETTPDGGGTWTVVWEGWTTICE